MQHPPAAGTQVQHLSAVQAQLKQQQSMHQSGACAFGGIQAMPYACLGDSAYLTCGQSTPMPKAWPHTRAIMTNTCHSFIVSAGCVAARCACQCACRLTTVATTT